MFNIQNNQTNKMVVLEMPEKICDICSKKINLNDHPLGLVFEDQIFICQDCSIKHSQKELSKLSLFCSFIPFKVSFNSLFI